MDSSNNNTGIYIDSKVNNKMNKIDNNNNNINNNNKKKSKHSPVLSAELGDLLQWLLEKPPNNRCEWSELLTHPFWNTENTNSRDSNQYENNFPAQYSYDVSIMLFIYYFIYLVIILFIILFIFY
jgi:serine/threonine protein kinase